MLWNVFYNARNIKEEYIGLRDRAKFIVDSVDIQKSSLTFKKRG